MATYKEIYGKGIKNLSSDLSGDAHLGQIWYNTTSNTFKTLLSVAAWSSGTNLPQAINAIRGCGTQTAALGFGGGTPAGPPYAINTSYE